jgi:hypothetical protein
MAVPKKKRRKLKHKTEKPLLSVQDVRFCQKIVTENLSTYEAYRQAGYPEKPTRNATDTAAFRLVRNRKIREYIRHLQNVAAKAAQITVEEIAAGIANIIKFDVRKIIDKNNNVLPAHKWPDHIAAAIESIEWGEVGTMRKRIVVKKVKTSSKLAAYAKLAEWKRMTGVDKVTDGKGVAEPLIIEVDTSASEQ